jgi:aldehyde dehydrogenase (NAD+)
MSITEIFRAMDYGPAPEAPGPALEWLESHRRRFDLFVGGEWREPGSRRWFDTHNPATGKPIAEIAQADRADVDAAVAAARAAQAEWWEIGGHARARYLYALARQIQKHARLFAVLESLDNGKPIRETRDLDIPLVARHFYHHAGWAQLMESEMPGAEPLGVCGQIIPWNFPLLMLSWKIAPALAMGNAVVLKPAEFTSLTALLFAEICARVGLPKGVVNIVTGDGATGALIVDHPDVDKIAFTGSTEVGRIIRKATAGTGKKLSLELGGKSPYIVFEDADLDSSVEGLVDAIWFNQGQVCCAGSRLLVQESVAERVHEKIRVRMDKLRIGDPLDKAVDIGAIVAPVQLERIRELVDQGVKEGASLHQGSCPCPEEGWFYPPTLLSGVSPAATVAQVEIFGPVLVSMTFRTPKEAVEIANNTPYGLAASVWTENLNLALDVAAKVKAGTVWVNSTNLFDAASGFGGYRESGYGREGGKEGLREYVRRSAGILPAKSDAATRPAESVAGKMPALRVDRTHKQYIGGKQARPDSGYSDVIETASGASVEIARGNRKDIRNAVEAAKGAQPGWAAQSAHGRAQVLYYLAENLEAERGGFEQALRERDDDPSEVDAAVRAAFDFAAWADKFDGSVHGTPFRGLTYTLNEPIGVVAIVCGDKAPLHGLVALAGAAMAMGNAVVVVPSERNPLPAVELYRVVEASDVPAGVLNLVTGPANELARVLAEHDGVDAIWHFGDRDGAADVERLSAGNLKQTWTSLGKGFDPTGRSEDLLRHAVQVKNVWVPYGE